MANDRRGAIVLGDLIGEALDAGLDIEIRLTPTADGKPGTMSVPQAWAERLRTEMDGDLRKQPRQ